MINYLKRAIVAARLYLMRHLFRLPLILGLFFCSAIAPAFAAPRIAFSDLISGPSQGLNDGKGVGAIVTLWGYDFEASQSQVYVTDSAGVRRPAAHIYYWKAADGTLPGGPSELFKTHKLYEIAFSLPNSSNGIAKIQVEALTGQFSDGYEFTIREGNIYHVKPTGNNSSGDGSFNNPWGFINGHSSSKPAPGNMGLIPGDVLYSHGVAEPVFGGGGRDYAMFLRALKGTLDKQISFSAYPDTRPLVQAPRAGLNPYLSSGIVISKFTFKGGLLDDPNDDSPTFGAGSTLNSTAQIVTSENGRIIGNLITDIPGKCSNGWNAAISSGGMGSSNVKVYGNFIHDLGCRQTSHFHHTTYMSKRRTASDPASQAWDFGWNYLKDNEAKYGIHFYDQSPFDSTNCGDVVGTLRVRYNFIENQRGTGINIRTDDHDNIGDCWSASVEVSNNIILNSGLGPVSELNNGTSPYGIDVGGDIGGPLLVSNNLVSRVSDASSRIYADAAAIVVGKEGDPEPVVIARNVVDIPEDGFKIKLVRTQNKNAIIEDNVFYRTGGIPSQNISEFFPDFFLVAQNFLLDPMLQRVQQTISYEVPNPKETGYINYPSKSQDRSSLDFYGRETTSPYIGPINISNLSSTPASPPQPPIDISVN
jgi:hypothetical protein